MEGPVSNPGLQLDTLDTLTLDSRKDVGKINVKKKMLGIELTPTIPYSPLRCMIKLKLQNTIQK